MHAFTVHPQKPPPAKSTPSPRRRRWLALGALLLAVIGIAWAVRPHSRLARAQALQKELFGPAGKALSKEERKARFAEYREQVKQLTDDQKWELSAPMREKQKADMDRYFAMSPVEKARYLDDRIDREQKMRQAWQQKASQSKNGTGKGGAPPGGGFGGGSGPGGKGGSTGRPPGRSPEEIEKRRKQHLDRTSPEERARHDQFRKDMDARRRQRGRAPRA
jgi:uncharacterized membrane protein YgcG